jgi:hypothetical protein
MSAAVWPPAGSLSEIPDEAVEAAREAVRAAMIEFGPDGHTDGDEEITRAALEAAAPHMLAAAWREGHDAGRDYQGDGWNSDAHDPDDDNPYRSRA